MAQPAPRTRRVLTVTLCAADSADADGASGGGASERAARITPTKIIATPEPWRALRRSPLISASVTLMAGYAEETGAATVIVPISKAWKSARDAAVLMSEPIIAKIHGRHPKIARR